MNIDITKIANAIILMIDKKVKHLDDRKLSIMLFLMDYNHKQIHNELIFSDDYIKNKKLPQSQTLNELFDLIASEEDLSEDDERFFLIEELIEYINIDITPKEKFTELKFSKNENEEFDDELFEKEELKTIKKVIKTYEETTFRNISNEPFALDLFRDKKDGEYIF